MCGRYAGGDGGEPNAELLIRVLKIIRDNPDIFPPRRDNISPTQSAPIVRERDGGRHVDELRWGLVPKWVKDPKDLKAPLINARGESVATKPSFREAFRRRRCLVPAAGFYEWKKDGAKKIPHFIRREDEGMMMFAGLWEHWEKGDEAIDSYTIITTDALPGLRELHDRMPVIVSPNDFDAWLDPSVSDADRLAPIVRPNDDGGLVYYPQDPRDGVMARSRA
ncbi:SOS response-associated peptidase [bacterium]|nr:SOS response-associated peptidase [bacterium]